MIAPVSSWELRGWQEEALLGWLSREPRDELVVAAPAAGKTRFSARLAHALLRSQRVRHVLLVVPKLHLKRQAARAYARFGMKIEWRWDGGRLPRDVHGAAVTYQQVAADPKSLARVAHGSFSVFDEVHHASTERAWGQALSEAFETANHRLELSGTIERTDGAPVPFVTYDERGYPVANYEYPYTRAVADGVCRPIAFAVGDGQATWIDSQGRRQTAVAAQAADLGTRALSEWWTTQQDLGMTPVLEAAHEDLLQYRRNIDRVAGGLVIARDQEHARAVASLLYGITGDEPALVVSDEEDADKRLEAFSRGRGAWIVAVHMVSEGIDIPRLRVGVYASNVVTNMYFKQFCGRFQRVTDHGGAARAYIPAHPKILDHARSIETDVRVGLAARRGTRPVKVASAAERPQSQYEGLSGGLETYESHVAGERALSAHAVEDQEWDKKEKLREQVNGMVNRLARLSNQSQAAIHGRLNSRFHDTLPTAAEWTLESRITQLEMLLYKYERQ